MIRAIAIDDEHLALKIVSHFCEKLDTVVLEKTFTKQSEALQYIHNFPVDLIFLDIQMPNKNGMEFYKMLDQDIPVIFTTAYSEYAVEGFNVSATDYLLKPFSFERFEEAVNKVVKELELKNNSLAHNHIMIRADYKLHRVDLDNIVFIEGLDDYIQIHLKDKSKLVTRMSMKTILEQLPDAMFVRVHRSYIVAVNKVVSIQNKSVKIDQYLLPIGDTYKKIVAEVFS
ncbi:MAG: response regulator transcription factor [Flavobacteriales bacterium]|nr:response regulator transcription factor [Flavobacteriales bacterium]